MISEHTQQLHQDARVTLFEIDARAVDAGLLRFSPEAVDGGPARFGGEDYTPIPIAAEGFEWASGGKLPRPTLSVSALSLSFLSLVISSNDLTGLPIRRIRTYRRHLDDGDDPDDQATLPIDHYVFEQKTRETSSELTFQLATAMDQQNRQIPARQALRDTCTQVYRTYDERTGQYNYAGVTCPYTGSGAWDAAGNPVPASQDVCGKRISDCKRRFGENGRLYTRAFPGLGRTR